MLVIRQDPFTFCLLIEFHLGDRMWSFGIYQNFLLKWVFVTVLWALDELTVFLFIFVWVCKFPANRASLNIGLLHLVLSFLYPWHCFSDTGDIDLSSLTLIHCFLLCWRFLPLYLQWLPLPSGLIYPLPISLLSIVSGKNLFGLCLFLSHMHVCTHTWR